MPQRGNLAPSWGVLPFSFPLGLVQVILNLEHTLLSFSKVLFAPYALPSSPQWGLHFFYATVRIFIWLNSESRPLPPDDVFLEDPSVDLTE